MGIFDRVLCNNNLFPSHKDETNKAKSSHPGGPF